MGLKKKVVVAMSGGVDSSVSAALLVREGYEVVGVTLRLFREKTRGGVSCCGSSSSMEKARKVCDGLGIRHYYKNAVQLFSSVVIENFVKGYAAGFTPNPCVECNRSLKFSYLLSLADGMGAQFLATGHYARITRGLPAGPRLIRGADKSKDQSYFLYCIGRESLSRIIFPLGEMTKTGVRALAGEFGIAAAREAESQDICFVPSGKYSDFIRGECRDRGLNAGKAGNIVGTGGRLLGRHDGIFGFTVGQRQGLRVQGPHPYYVVSIDASSGTVVAGEREEALSGGCVVSGVNWISPEPPAEVGPAEVQIRYRHKPARARLFRESADVIRVEFESPEFAITPGQSAVFYRGAEVLGGGIISSAVKTI